MIDNMSIVPKPAFHALNPASVEAYLERMPKGSRLYANLASHGDGVDETQPFIASNGNAMVYLAFSFVSREIFNKDSINKVLQVCSYVDFKYALVIMLALHEKIGSEKIQESISIYLQQSASDSVPAAITERMNVFLNRLSNFLTIFSLEYIDLNKRDSLNNEA